MEDGQGNGDVLERDGLLNLLVLIYHAQQRLVGQNGPYGPSNDQRDTRSGLTLLDLGLELGDVVLLPLAER